ncbi:hypothetical protein OAL21_02180 [Akkermansiaceae bacterium]|nr:hypothetical protein [Akkermansiaceae bacterium]
MYCSEVIGFADVFIDVVKFLMAVFVVANELVVALANNARRFAALVAVVRVVPIEKAFRTFSSECGDKRDAIDVVSGELFESSEFKESGVEVSSGCKLAGGRTGFGDAGGYDVVRLTDAAFPLTAFSSAKGEAGGGKGVARGNAAVVGGENYNGVFIEAEFF